MQKTLSWNFEDWTKMCNGGLTEAVVCPCTVDK